MTVPKLSVRRVVSLAILVLAVIFIGKNVAFPDKYLPEEFTEAREQSAKIAEEIVAQSVYSAQLLDEISKLDREGNYYKALQIVSKELEKNKEANRKATTLSSRLEKMARAIEAIEPSRARQLATEALSSEVALVSRLISYNSYVGELFGVLGEKFKYGRDYSNGKVQELVKAINNEVYAINELNNRFNSALAKFDKIF